MSFKGHAQFPETLNPYPESGVLERQAQHPVLGLHEAVDASFPPAAGRTGGSHGHPQCLRGGGFRV